MGPDQRSENSRGVRGIAVGILPAPGGIVNRLVPVAFPIQQAHDHVPTVQLGIDVEGLLVAIGAMIDFAPLRLH